MGEMADELIDMILGADHEYQHTECAPECKRCGKQMRWGEFSQGWRLINSDNTLHLCGAVADVDEFSEVP